VINPDPPERSAEVRRSTGLTLPLLQDPNYTMASRFELRGVGRPMGGLVGFVLIDKKGIIRVQRVDLEFGRHAKQIAEGLRLLDREQ
jgi:peroxiredoxin